MKPYVCVGTIVQLRDNNEGTVICVDNRHSMAVVQVGNSFRTEKTLKLTVVSYEGVE